MILFEDNNDIESLYNFTMVKCKEFRIKYPKSKLIKYLLNFNTEILNNWMDKYSILGIEPPKHIEESLKNDLLDIVNMIKRIEEKNINNIKL